MKWSIFHYHVSLPECRLLRLNLTEFPPTEFSKVIWYLFSSNVYTTDSQLRTLKRCLLGSSLKKDKKKRTVFQIQPSWSNFSDVNLAEGHKTEAGGTYAGTTDLTKDINKSVISSRDGSFEWMNPGDFFVVGYSQMYFFGGYVWENRFWSAHFLFWQIFLGCKENGPMGS